MPKGQLNGVGLCLSSNLVKTEFATMLKIYFNK